MARVITSGLLGNITGSIAGTTFQNGINGQIIRKKPIPKKAYNNSQQAIRLIQSRINFEWAALTDTQRASWIGKVGIQFKTDKQAFSSANFYRIFYGQSIIQTPSFNPTPPPIGPTDLVLSGGFLDVLADFNANLATYMVILKMSYPVGQTVTKSRNNLRLLLQPVVDSTVIVVTPVYAETVHVVPVLGMKIWVSMALQHRTSGDLSPFTTKLLEVVAP